MSDTRPGPGGTIIVAVNGKEYIVKRPRAYRTATGYGGGEIIVAYPYWSTRNGDYFGPSRIATATGGTIGRKLVAAARVAFDVDHRAMVAEVLAREVAAENTAR